VRVVSEPLPEDQLTVKGAVEAFADGAKLLYLVRGHLESLELVAYVVQAMGGTAGSGVWVA